MGQIRLIEKGTNIYIYEIEDCYGRQMASINILVVEHKEKWEVIKTHTARRTFISLMLEAGENTTTIRSITGHTQLSSFSRYVAVSDTKKAKAVKWLDW